MARIHGENNVKHWYCIKDERFDVDEDAYNALNGMMLCKVYFTPRSKLLLSIEPK
jgi:hypothetical protein